MKITKVFSSVLIIVLFSTTLIFAKDITAAQISTPNRLTSTDDVKRLCDSFMMNLNAEGVETSFNILRPYSSVDDVEFNRLKDQTKEMLIAIEADIGNKIGYILMDKKNLNDVLLRFIYIQKFQKHILRWTFYFYKANKEWSFSEFNIDNKFKEMF